MPLNNEMPRKLIIIPKSQKRVSKQIIPVCMENLNIMFRLFSQLFLFVCLFVVVSMYDHSVL